MPRATLTTAVVRGQTANPKNLTDSNSMYSVTRRKLLLAALVTTILVMLKKHPSLNRQTQAPTAALLLLHAYAVYIFVKLPALPPECLSSSSTQLTAPLMVLKRCRLL
jgi:uncharacterized membrane protein